MTGGPDGPTSTTHGLAFPSCQGRWTLAAAVGVREPGGVDRPSTPQGPLAAQRPLPTWERVLPYAVRAPSSHNSQPWRFELAADGRLLVHADRSRALRVVDPDDRELVMSCGAALAHVGVALRHFGHAGDVVVFPDPGEPDLLATVGLGRPHQPTTDDHRLLTAIESRQTHRAAFASNAVSSRTLTRLGREAERFGVVMTILTRPESAAVADLVGQGDRLQLGDRHFRRELAGWLRPNHTRRRDGMRGDSLGLGGLTSLLAPSIVARIDTGAGQARKDEALALAAPALVLLSTPRDTPEDWLAAGEAVAMVLLRATVHGMAASFLNQPIEVPTLRDRLRSLPGGDACPQLLLRVGYAPTGDRPASRRPVVDVLS